MAACQKVEVENKAKTGLLDKIFEVGPISSEEKDSDSNVNTISSKNNNHEENGANGFLEKGAQTSWINLGINTKAKKKLIRIFVKEVPIPK